MELQSISDEECRDWFSFYSDSLARTYHQIVIKLSKNEIEVQNVQDVNRIRLPFFTYWDKAS